jgi:hypothetical protein
LPVLERLISLIEEMISGMQPFLVAGEIPRYFGVCRRLFFIVFVTQKYIKNYF